MALLKNGELADIYIARKKTKGTEMKKFVATATDKETGQDFTSPTFEARDLDHAYEIARGQEVDRIRISGVREV